MCSPTHAQKLKIPSPKEGAVSKSKRWQFETGCLPGRSNERVKSKSGGSRSEATSDTGVDSNKVRLAEDKARSAGPGTQEFPVVHQELR